jgi:hypothetical protein
MKLMCPLDYTLTQADSERAIGVAHRRNDAAIHLPTTHGFTGDPITIHIPGAMAELAFCQCVGREWEERINNFKAPDFGKKTQIRCSTCKNEFPPRDFGNLVINAFGDPKHNDNPDDDFVLVVGNPPNFTVKGWIPGRVAMRDGKNSPWWRKADPERPPAFFVPWRALNPNLTELPDLKPDLAGFVGYDEEGHFLHYCKCGKWGSISVGASVRTGKLGTWYCPPCHPNPTFSSR